MIIIDQEYCKGCSICTAFCPLQVLRTSKRINRQGYYVPEAAQDERCIGCRFCELLCPEFAIMVVNERPARRRSARAGWRRTRPRGWRSLGARRGPARVLLVLARVHRGRRSLGDLVVVDDPIDGRVQRLEAEVDVVANDSDAEGTLVPSSFVLVDPPSRGGTVVNPHDGRVELTPKRNFLGTDTFTYGVFDDQGARSNAVKVSINVIK
jgi:2-oxoglutarate ferredoxin oxidoreductase subunit delta